MVEETTQASRRFAGEADTLMTLIQQFRIDAEPASSYDRTRNAA
jgi:methyl-accepting chemotaxis protein